MGLLSVLYFSKPVFMWALAFDVLLEPKYECLTSLGLGDFYRLCLTSDLQRGKRARKSNDVIGGI